LLSAISYKILELIKWFTVFLLANRILKITAVTALHGYGFNGRGTDLNRCCKTKTEMPLKNIFLEVF
jgi:hypothetical protein